VARVDASASLIPAVNKLGTMGLILRGSDELKKKVLPEIADGKMASYALSEREAGSDAASMRTRAKADGDDWILNGSKCWITNGGKSAWYTVMAVSDPDKGANGISAFMVHEDDEGFTVGPKERKLGIKGSPTTELYFENCRIPGDRIIGEPDLGFISAASKCFASDVAMEVTTDAVQLFGGAGYTVDFPVERMMRDAKITQIYEGTNQIQRVVMSRALLR